MAAKLLWVVALLLSLLLAVLNVHDAFSALRDTETFAAVYGFDASEASPLRNGLGRFVVLRLLETSLYGLAAAVLAKNLLGRTKGGRLVPNVTAAVVILVVGSLFAYYGLGGYDH